MEPLDGSLSESIPMSSLCTNSTYNQSPCFSVHYASMYSKLFYSHKKGDNKGRSSWLRVELNCFLSGC